MGQAPSSASLRPASADCALTFGKGPTADERPGLASANGPGLDGFGEPFKEPLQRLSGRATGSADLDGLQTTPRHPTVDQR